MGKNKIGGAQRNQAVAAPPPKPPDTVPATTDWFSNLSPEEQELEIEKKADRERKALAAKKKDDESRQWREQQEGWQAKADRKAARATAKQDKEWEEVLERARNELLLSEEHVDGLWYVEIEKGTWKQVDDTYWCNHCKTSLNEHTLGPHLYGARHQKCFGASGGWPDSSSAPAAPGAAAGDVGELEVWQEYDDTQGCIRCKACNKNCDAWHVKSEDHQKKLQTFLWNAQADDAAYAAPAAEWLAWVPDASFGPRRYLRCLLCDKWAQDFDADNTEAYAGHHGRLGPGNQKDHRRKLEHLDYYLAELADEKRKWHPSATAADSQSERPAGARHVAAGAAPDPPDLPEGWRAAWCAEHGRFYFWSVAAWPRETQWEAPTAPSQPSVPPPAEERAPRPAPAETQEDETSEC